MNHPAASCGVSENAMRIIPNASPRMFYSGVQFRTRLDSRRRTDPSEAMWRTRLKHAGMTVFGKKSSSTQQAAGN